MAALIRQRKSGLLRILFEGTTSHNARDDILASFDQVGDWPAAPQVCAYYQGCGCDLITLACDSVDTHILSDRSPKVADQLAKKLTQLSDHGLITELDGEERHWRFKLGGRPKSVHFTEEPLAHLYLALGRCARRLRMAQTLGSACAPRRAAPTAFTAFIPSSEGVRISDRSAHRPHISRDAARAAG